MPSLKDLRVRINSVKSTQKITQAMKMVAASKLRRAQEAAEAGRPYAERMERMLASLAQAQAGREGAPALLAGTGKDETRLIVLATSDRGLCGAFNSTLVRRTRELIARARREGKTVKVLCLGQKGRDQLRRDHGALIVDTVRGIGPRGVRYDEAVALAERVLAMFDEGAFDSCVVVYNTFKSVLSQEVTVQQLVPFAVAGDGAAALDGAVYEFEPDEDVILNALLPRNLAVQIYRALLENAASEQGARMTAMDNATRNAGDVIDKLTLSYNRTRQAVITREMIEIVSGAEAL